MAHLGACRAVAQKDKFERSRTDRGRVGSGKVPKFIQAEVALPIRQRGRRRRGGRAVRERGRMRKRGPRGGGTLRRKSPQQRQWPSPPKGAVASARSQRPRASHCGLIHCTVKPGKNCIFLPQWPQSSGRLIPLPRSYRKKTACQRLRLQHSFGTRGNSGRDGADSDANALWCQEKRLQDIVVRLQVSSHRRIATCGRQAQSKQPGGRGPAGKS